MYEISCLTVGHIGYMMIFFQTAYKEHMVKYQNKRHLCDITIQPLIFFFTVNHQRLERICNEKRPPLSLTMS